MLKRIGIVVVILILIGGGAGWYLYTQLGSFIVTAIEKYGSAATQASVTVSGVRLSPASGEATIVGLNVGNPAGFATPNAVTVRAITVTIDVQSLIGSGPVLIKEVDIDRPSITYEAGKRGSNLEALARNAQADTGGAASTPNAGGPARKLIIEDFYVRDGEINVSATVLRGRSLGVPFPTIHLTNIGKSSGGATPAQIADKIVRAISRKADTIGAEALAGALKGVVNGVTHHIIKAPKNVGDKINGLFGN